MNTRLTHMLSCPYDHASLNLACFQDRVTEKGERVIVDGSLTCTECGLEYPIIDEIAFVAERELLEGIGVVARFWQQRGALTKSLEAHANRDQKLLRDVQSFWSDRPTAGKWDTEEEQMEGLEQWRRDTCPWLETLAGYDKHRGELMLEVGCGQGLCTFRFAQNGSTVVALDLSYDSVILAQKRIRGKGLSNTVDFVLGNAENLPFRDNQFDFVYSHGVIHHSPDTAACIRQISRVTKPGAPLFVMYYYTWSLTRLIEATARFIHKLLTWVTGDDQAFLKMARRFLKGYSDKHTAQFLRTGKAATLHAPVIHTYSRRQTRAMFSAAGLIHTQMTLTHLSDEVAFVLKKLRLSFLIPVLEKWVGWDLITTARKRG